MNLQHLILFGRATKDAEIFETKKKTKFAKFSVAINDYYKKEKTENVSYYDVLVFGNTVSTVYETVKKGDQILVDGRPEIEAYLSKENEPKAKINVIAESWKIFKPDLSKPEVESKEKSSK